MFASKKGITLLTILAVCAHTDNEPQLNTEDTPEKAIHEQYKNDLEKNVALITQILDEKDELKKCSNKKITFYLYKLHKNGVHYPTLVSEKTQHITLNSMAGSNTKYLKIMIHGEFGHKDDGFNRMIREGYFKKEKNRNILAVDYHFIGKNLIGMLQHVHDVVELVAKCTVRILDKMENETNDDILTHVIGFQFGTQIAGSLADQLLMTNTDKLVIKRITALEPVLLFSEGNRSTSILKKESAPIVDVLYTNVGGFGQIFPIGTHSFYANGGLCQPECEKYDDQAFICSHERAYILFAESIEYTNPNCGFFADKWSNNNPMRFLHGPKNENIHDNTKYKFGEHMDTNKIKVGDGVFYFKTNRTYPFAQNESDCSDNKFNLIKEMVSNIFTLLDNHPPLHKDTDSFQISQYDGPLYDEDIVYQ